LRLSAKPQAALLVAQQTLNQMRYQLDRYLGANLQ
jgi:hypothetical protein